MSGPWDRPPSSDPGDSWPSEDLKEGAAGQPASDGWPSDDPWAAPESDATGWGAWPPPPPPEENLGDEADLPVADPWAESWTDDAPDAGAAPRREPEPWVSREPARAEPWMPSEEPWSLVAGDDVPPSSDWREPVVDAASSPVEEVAPQSTPVFEPEIAPEPEPERHPAPEPEPEPVVEPEPESVPEVEPDVEPEAPAASFEPDVPRPSWVVTSPWSRRHRKPEPEPEPEPVPGSEAEPEDVPESPDRGGEDGQPDAAVEAVEADVPRPSWVVASPWSRRSPEPDQEPEADAEPESEPEAPPEGEPDTEPEQGVEPELATEVESEPEPQPEFEPQAEIESEPEIEPEPESEPEQDSEPLPEPEPASPGLPDWGESTQVLPSTWTPIEPAPAEPDPGALAGRRSHHGFGRDRRAG